MLTVAEVVVYSAGIVVAGAFVTYYIRASLPRRAGTGHGGASPLVGDELAALTSERESLVTERRRNNRLSIGFGISAVLLSVFSSYQPAGSNSGALLGQASILSITIASCFFALYRGYHLAFGLLSLLVLVFFPDRNHRRLMELDQVLSPDVTGVAKSDKLPKFFWRSIGCSLFYPLSPLALYWSVRGWQDAKSSGRAVGWAIMAVVLSSLATFVLATVMIFLLMGKAGNKERRAAVKVDLPVASSTALSNPEHNLCMELGPGWVENPTLAQAPAMVFGVSNRSDDLHLTVSTDNKKDLVVQDLNHYAMLVLDLWKQSVTSAKASDLQPVSVAGMPAIQFTITGSADQKTVIGAILTVFETPNEFVQIRAWTLASRFETHTEDLNAAIQAVRTLSVDQNDP